jgi:hypothetical protein
MLRKRNERKATPINNADIAEISLPGGEFPLSSWKYKMPSVFYHKMCK